MWLCLMWGCERLGGSRGVESSLASSGLWVFFFSDQHSKCRQVLVALRFAGSLAAIITKYVF